MSTDSSQRQEFEKWAEKDLPNFSEHYKCGAWLGWQASNTQSQELIAELINRLESMHLCFEKELSTNGWVSNDLLLKKAKSHLKQQEQE